MKKYKIEFFQKERFIVDVLAKNQKEAIELAEQKWNNDDYEETGEIEIELGTIYNVSNTDDPFNP